MYFVVSVWQWWDCCGVFCRRGRNAAQVPVGHPTYQNPSPRLYARHRLETLEGAAKFYIVQ